MKFKIMTLDRRAFVVNLNESKTVWDLKVQIHRNRGSWLHPHNQRLLYGGQVLDDKRILRSYSIDERKFLLMLAKKATINQINRKPSLSSTDCQSPKPIVTDNKKQQSMVSTKPSTYKIKRSSSALTTTTTTTETANCPNPNGDRVYTVDEPFSLYKRKIKNRNSDCLDETSRPKCGNLAKEKDETVEMYPMYIPTEDVKKHIMKLGPWKELDVRRALLISLNNPNRAIQYLLNEKSPFPKMVTPPSSRLFLSDSIKKIYEHDKKPQSPELNSVSEESDFEQATSTAKINNNNNNNNSQENKNTNKNIKWNFIKSKLSNSTHDIHRLIEIGFPRDAVVETYYACEKNTELTAELLYEQYLENNLYF